MAANGSRRRAMAWLGLVFFAEGLPYGLFHGVLPAYLVHAGLPAVQLPRLMALDLAWTLKVLWASRVARARDGRTWARGSLLVMALGVVGLALSGGAAGGGGVGPLAWGLVAAFVLASATLDLVVDGATLGLVRALGEGPANAVRVVAYRIGLTVGGSGLLALAPGLGWARVAALAASLLACLLFVPWRAPRSREPPPPPLRGQRLPHGWAGCLPWVFAYASGAPMAHSMAQAFWLHRGHDLRQLAAVGAGGTLFASTLGAVGAGGLIARRGLYRSLWVLGAAQATGALGYLAVAQGGAGWGALAAASLWESFAHGLGAAALLALLSRLCAPTHATIQFAWLTATAALARALGGLVAGRVAQAWGFAALFATAALVALASLACLPRLQRWLAVPRPGDAGGATAFCGAPPAVE